MLEIVKYPAEILDKQMPRFDFDNPIMDPKELKEKMLEAMFDLDGVGLSACQVGIETAVFTMGSKHHKDKAQIFINPVVLDASTDMILDWEGCLSFPGVFVKINRPSWIVAEFFDENGEKQVGKIEGYDARCYLHECDHLNGIVYKDRVSKMKWDMATKRANKLSKKGLVNA
jgi:peptide deformylase